MWRYVLTAVMLVGCGSTSTPTGVGEDPPDDPVVPAVGDPVAALRALPAACSTDHWCWRRPTPRGTRFTAVHATAADNLWLAGEAGYVLQWNGTAWREHALPDAPFAAIKNLSMIAGTSARDMWVAGNNLLYHWDGAAWTLRDSIAPSVDQQFHGLWVAPDGDVWVTMEYGVVKRAHAGGAFETIDVAPAQRPLSALGAIWGTASDDVWISGRPGRMFHWDGAAFTESATGTVKSGGNLWGTSKTDAWIGGYDGTLVHWDGTAWRVVDTGLGEGWYIKGIASTGNDPRDVSWLAQRASNQTALLHWDGAQLTSTKIATDVMLSGLAIVDGRWWLPGDHGAVYVKTGNELTAAIAPAPEALRTAWGTSDRDMYFGGPGALLHWDGAAWSTPTTAVQNVRALAGTADGREIWAIGDGATNGALAASDVLHFVDGAWRAEAITGQLAAPRLTGVWAPRAGEALAVGDGGAVYWNHDGAWQAIASGVASDLTAVWGPDADRAWLIGADGTILRWERSAPDALVREASPVTGALTAIHGAGDAVWITSNELGADHQLGVLERTADGWVRRAVPNLLSADTVFVNAANDVRIAGANNGGAVFHWNGRAFAAESTLSANSFAALFQPPGGSLWLVGDNAVLQQAR